ncbi:MAG: TlpA family protein disulfide reductase [Bryobacteraceae bacterium]|nr:TlpA family protein disulfide reductase [Bryobacteraceae bacterium]
MLSPKLTLALVAILLGGLGFVIYDTLQEPNIKVGDAAPDFSIKGENGKVYTARDFGGKLLILNFWATWCPPCISETPRLTQLQNDLRKDGVVILGVSVDKNEKAYKQFIARLKVGFATAHDPEARISASYGTFKFPETYVINSQGKVVAKFIGEPDDTWLAPRVLDSLRSMI